MQSNIMSLVAFFGIASAAPSMMPRGTVTGPFGLTTLHSGSAVHLQPVFAVNSSIFAGTSSFQAATCDVTPANSFATFTLGDDGSLNLYSTSAPYQTTYVDQSGMGQGVFQYTTGAQPTSVNGQRGNFTLDDANDLTFNGAGFLACPSADNWSLWVSSGVDQPAGNTGCVGVSLRATQLDNPVSCLYVQ